MSIEINNESSEYYENASSFDHNNKQRESLLQSFLKMGKRENDNLTKEDVGLFFEEEGILAPNLVSKLISGVFHNDDVLTVNQFITNFLTLQKELKMAHDSTLTKVQQQKLAIARYEKKLNDCKNEILDDNGLCSDSNVKIDVLECNMAEVGYDECHIKIAMNDQMNAFENILSKIKKSNQESCTFKPTTKNDSIVVTLYGTKDKDSDQIELGSVDFSLNEMMRQNNKQEEFEIDLTIPDDKENIVGEIKIRILFIYSYYEYYSDLIQEEKKILDNYEKNIYKSKGYLDQIRELKSIKLIDTSLKEQMPSRQNQSRFYDQNQIKQPSTNLESNANLNANINSQSKTILNDAIKQEPNKITEQMNNEEGEFVQIANEELIKRQLTIYLLYALIGICLFSLLVKADFVNALITFMTYFNVRYNFIPAYTNKILMAIGGSIALDIIWMIIAVKGAWLGSVLGKIIALLVPLGVVIKGGVLFKILSSFKNQKQQQSTN